MQKRETKQKKELNRETTTKDILWQTTKRQRSEKKIVQLLAQGDHGFLEPTAYLFVSHCIINALF